MSHLGLAISLFYWTGVIVSSEYEAEALHTQVRQDLALEIAKRKNVLPYVPCSKVRSTLEGYGKWALDRLYCPPFQRLFLRSGDVPLKFAAIVPVIAPALGLYVVGPEAYSTYISERRKLVAFKYNVERLQKYVKLRSKTKEFNDISKKINWFLEEGYDEAHEHLMNKFCDVLEEQLKKYNDEYGREQLKAYEKKEHKRHD
jgi:hypothetical protein